MMQGITSLWGRRGVLWTCWSLWDLLWKDNASSSIWPVCTCSISAHCWLTGAFATSTHMSKRGRLSMWCLFDVISGVHNIKQLCIKSRGFLKFVIKAQYYFSRGKILRRLWGLFLLLISIFFCRIVNSVQRTQFSTGGGMKWAGFSGNRWVVFS